MAPALTKFTDSSVTAECNHCDKSEECYAIHSWAQSKEVGGFRESFLEETTSKWRPEGRVRISCWYGPWESGRDECSLQRKQHESSFRWEKNLSDLLCRRAWVLETWGSVEPGGKARGRSRWIHRPVSSGKAFKLYRSSMGSHWKPLNREVTWSDCPFRRVPLASVCTLLPKWKAGRAVFQAEVGSHDRVAARQTDGWKWKRRRFRPWERQDWVTDWM